MKIRKKIISILAIAWLLILLVLGTVSTFLILVDYNHIDQQRLLDNLQRAKGALYDRSESIKKLTVDWAYWDAAYQFMVDKNPSFIQQNMSEPTFAEGKLNFILFFNPEGKFEYGKFYDLRYQRFNPIIPAPLLSSITDNPVIFNFVAERPDLQGFIAAGKKIVILSAAPILTSNKTGPARGTLLMGAYFSKTQIESLINIAKLPFEIYNLSHPANQNAFSTVKENLQDEEFYIENTNNAEMAGYFYLKDIANHPIALIRISAPRYVYTKGILSIYYYLGTMLIFGLLIGLLVWIALKKVILNRLFSLNQQVHTISEEKKFSTSTKVSGDDEIKQISSSINNLLGVIKEDEQQLHEKVQTLAETNQLLEDEIQQRVAIEAELEAKKNQFDYLAHHDSLTGLPNRVLFIELLTNAIHKSQRNKKRMAVLYIDLDGFKEINDQYGHKYGDNLLKILAKELKKTLRKSDVLARLGGDEFILFTTEETHFDPAFLAQKVLAVLAKPIETEGHTVNLSASIGISLYPTHATEAAELQRTADIAMYSAKKSGKNKFLFYDASMRMD